MLILHYMLPLRFSAQELPISSNTGRDSKERGKLACLYILRRGPWTGSGTRLCKWSWGTVTLIRWSFWIREDVDPPIMANFAGETPLFRCCRRRILRHFFAHFTHSIYSPAEQRHPQNDICSTLVQTPQCLSSLLFLSLGPLFFVDTVSQCHPFFFFIFCGWCLSSL